MMKGQKMVVQLSVVWWGWWKSNVIGTDNGGAIKWSDDGETNDGETNDGGPTREVSMIAVRPMVTRWYGIKSDDRTVDSVPAMVVQIMVGNWKYRWQALIRMALRSNVGRTNDGGMTIVVLMIEVRQ